MAIYYKRLKTIPDQCFDTGNYYGNDIAFAGNINDATSCQKECQKHAECKFWTYNSDGNRCWSQSANAPDSIGTCNTCTRGPRYCANGKQ